MTTPSDSAKPSDAAKRSGSVPRSNSANLYNSTKRSDSTNSLKNFFFNRTSVESPGGMSPRGSMPSSPLRKSDLVLYGMCEGKLDDKFSLLEEIGRGAFGTVYRCMDKATRGICCCKSISKAGLTDEQIEDQRREAEIMLKLNGHPHIVTVSAVFEEDKYLHIVQELCTGGDVLTWLSGQTKAITEKKAAFIIRSALTVVDHCHKNGVLYRDIKPDNFLMSSSSSKSVLKATDFGVSVYLGANDVCNVLCGTKAYMAPEVYDEEYGYPSDLWSVGVMMYLILCGHFPFQAKNDMEMANIVYIARYDTSGPEWNTISDIAKDMLSKLLTRDAATRLTASEALEHKWFQKHGAADEALSPEVRHRIKAYALAHCPRRRALLESARVLDLESKPWIEQLLTYFEADTTGCKTLQDALKAFKAEQDEATRESIRVFVEEQRQTEDGEQAAGIAWNKIDTSLQDFLTTVIQKFIGQAQRSLQQVCRALDTEGTGLLSKDALITALPEAGLSWAQEQKMVRAIHGDLYDNEGLVDYSAFLHASFEKMLPPLGQSRVTWSKSESSSRLSRLNSSESCAVM